MGVLVIPKVSKKRAKERFPLRRSQIILKIPYGLLETQCLNLGSEFRTIIVSVSVTEPSYERCSEVNEVR